MIDGLVMGMMGWHESFLQHALILALRDTRDFSQWSPSRRLLSDCLSSTGDGFPFVLTNLMMDRSWENLHSDRGNIAQE